MNGSRRRTGLQRSERGESLIEILFTIVILGITVTALIGSMTLTMVGSDAHRRLADTEVVTRDYAEALKSFMLHPVGTTLTSAIPTNHGSSLTFSVQTSGSFPTPPFGVEIDEEEFQITAVTGTTWTATAGGTEGHAIGANVYRYDACPTAPQVTPSFTMPPGAQKIAPPTVGTPVFYDTSGNTVPGTVVTASCANYWDATPPAVPSSQACATTGDHLTQCDPPVISVPVTVTSTDTDGKQTSTTTNVLVRRGNV